MIIHNSQLTIHPPIVSIGDLVADLVVALPALPVEAGQHQEADEIRLEPGGGANLLIAGARLGQPMAALGALGADDWGQRVAALLAAEGIDMAAVTHAGATTTVIVLVSRAGEHVFVGQYGHGPTLTLTPAASRLLAEAGAVYTAGYTLRETRLVELTLAALAQARAAGAPVFFDPGPHIATVPNDLRAQLLPLVDVLLATEEELALLTPGAAIAGVMAQGPATVVVKRGAAGCVVYQNNPATPVVEAAGYPVPVVDTSAAGDSFNAAFMVGWLRGWPLADCARLANAVGAAKVQKLGGGRNVPTRAEVRAVLHQFHIDLPVSL